MPRWKQTRSGNWLLIGNYYLMVYRVGKQWYSYHIEQRTLIASNTEDALKKAYEIELSRLTTDLSNLIRGNKWVSN
jgi:hypothetical protein